MCVYAERGTQIHTYAKEYFKRNIKITIEVEESTNKISKPPDNNQNIFFRNGKIITKYIMLINQERRLK